MRKSTTAIPQNARLDSQGLYFILLITILRLQTLYFLCTDDESTASLSSFIQASSPWKCEGLILESVQFYLIYNSMDKFRDKQSFYYLQGWTKEETFFKENPWIHSLHLWNPDSSLSWFRYTGSTPGLTFSLDQHKMLKASCHIASSFS